MGREEEKAKDSRGKELRRKWWEEQKSMENEKARRDEIMLIVTWVIKFMHIVFKIGTRIFPEICLNCIYVAF